MKNKEEKLLEYLVSEKDHWVSSSILSDYLSVSTRQIRKYINNINEYMEKPIIISSKSGYKIDYAMYKKFRTEYDCLNEDSPQTRQNYIIQKLICEKNGYSIFSLSEELFVSESTIENDLKTIRSITKEFQISLKKEKDMIQMIGDEKNKRRLISSLLSSDSYDNFVLKDEVRILIFHYHFWDFRKSLSKIFAMNDIFANDYTLNNTALHLIVMIDRIRNGCMIEDQVNLDKVKHTQQFRVAEQIKEHLEKTYQIIINDVELYNLTLVISNNTTMIDYSIITPDNINEYIEQKYITIAHKVIHEVEECYCLDVFDEDFITQFTIHIKNMFNRIHNNFYAKNPLTAKIKVTYPLIYDIAVFIAQRFKNDYQVTLTEDEITFIAFHIGSYFENNVQSKSKITCAFIYADYYSLHKNAMDKIIQKFSDQINIKYAISINNFNPAFIHADLIISTIDIPFTSNSVTVNPFLTEKDIRNIREAVEQISHQKRNNALKSYLMNFFNEKLFYKNPSFIEREGAIKIMSEDLVSLNYAEDSLFEEVMSREKLSSTAFSNVAVPHSLSKNANTSFISIALSEKPIKWGNHNVHIIALIGISSDSRKLFSEVFDEIIDILSEPAHVSELIKCNDFNDFINKIKQLMSK